MKHVCLAMKAGTSLFLASLMFLTCQTSMAHSAAGVTVKVEPTASSAEVGETSTINLTITNVQNLYGIDATLQWDVSVLQVLTVDLRLGVESYPDGVLHRSPNSPFIFVAENVTLEEGEYHLSATSLAPAPSFNGSGNMVRITFNVTSPGSSQFKLRSQLYDYPPLDREPRVSLPIEHDTLNGSFATIPEYPIIVIPLLLIAVTALVAVISKNIQMKDSPHQAAQ